MLKFDKRIVITIVLMVAVTIFTFKSIRADKENPIIENPESTATEEASSTEAKKWGTFLENTETPTEPSISDTPTMTDDPGTSESSKTRTVGSIYIPIEEPDVTPPPDVNGVRFSKAGGIYDSVFSLTLEAGSDYTIYYTLDGSDPKKNGLKYESPIQLRESPNQDMGPLTKSMSSILGYRMAQTEFRATTVKAYSIKDDNSTAVMTNTYFIAPGLQQQYNLPYVSLSLAPNDFMSRTGIYVSIGNNPFGVKERRIAFFELYSEKGVKVSEQYVELSMHGNGSLGNQQKSMRVYFKKDANPEIEGNLSKLSYDIFGGRAKDINGNTVQSYKRLVLRNSGNDCAKTMLRDSLIQRLCTGLNVDRMEAQPAMVFVNGEFWGLYNIRERYDEKYFESHYGVSEENIVILDSPSPLLTGSFTSPYEVNEGEPGDDKPFNDLVSYITKNNMSDAANYKYVADRIDLDNMIDYFCANIFFANKDWPGNNIRIWRNKNANDPSGWDTKWRFVLLDMDFGCGLVGQTETDMMSYLLNENWDKVATSIFSAMLNNREFKDKFIQRFVYICDEFCAPSVTVPVLEGMANDIKAAESLNVNRWISQADSDNLINSMNVWNSQINVVKSFLQNRGYYAKTHLYEYFGISPNEVTYSFNTSAVSLTVNGSSVLPGDILDCSQKSAVNYTVTVKSGYEFVGIAVTDVNGN
ncbi:MAG: CotH kinase family protein, partial [Clostridiales bacterium]|nr:CotH kinase family protein [Clostridiales bacterium]